MVEKDIKALWNSNCDVIELAKVKDVKTGRTLDKETKVLENIPCRVSFSSVNIPNVQDKANRLVQGIKLFISRDIDVKAGSKIVVRQNGREMSYINTGVPAIYTYHKEIPLEIFRGFA